MALFRHGASAKKRKSTQLRRYTPFIQKNDPVGLYFHIPFCVKKCPYCDFYSLPLQGGAKGDGKRLDEFTRALITGITDCGDIHPSLAVDTVYFGGGTPTCLGAERLAAVLSSVKKSFKLAKDAEITFEANPATAGVKDLKRLRKAGFNRVSVGVQSFSDAELNTLGRSHTVRMANEFLKACADAGFENRSLDLMYGLPGQTAESFADSLDRAIASGVSHLSLYCLKIEEGTPFYAAPPAGLPDDDAVADEYLAAVERLAQAGFEQYEISNFARDGKRARHNMKYWRCEEYLGFGPGAHSYYNNLRYSYIKDTARYVKIMREGGDSLIEGEPEEIRPRERVGEYLMLGLRLADGISAAHFRLHYARDFAPAAAVLDKYVGSGLVLRDGEAYRLSPKGFLVSNALIREVLDAVAEQ